MKKILSKTPIIFLLLLFLIEPDGIRDGATFRGGLFNIFHLFFNSAKYFSIALSFLMLFLMKRPSIMLMMVGVYNGYLLLSSMINENFTTSYLVIVTICVSLAIFTEYYMKEAPINFLKALSALLVIYICINLISLILYPEGLYVDDRWWSKNYFLGFKNRHIYYFLPCILCVSIYQFIQYKHIKLLFYVLLFIFMISCVLNSSTTSLIVIFLFCVMCLLLRRVKFPLGVNPAFFFIVGAIISFFMISTSITGKFDNSTDYLTEFFDKEYNTVGNRTVIWKESLLYIYRHPIIGNGNLTFDVGWDWDVSQVHNQYLDFIVQGGIILFIIFFIQIFLLSRKMSKLKSKEVYNILLFVLITYSIEFLMEGKRNHYLWFVSMMMAYNVVPIVNDLKIRKKIKKIT